MVRHPDVAAIPSLSLRALSKVIQMAVRKGLAKLHPGEENGEGHRHKRERKALTKQKLIAHVNPEFCALFRTCVYAKKNTIVSAAPMIIVPRRPQNQRLLHMKPARIGEGMPERLAAA